MMGRKSLEEKIDAYEKYKLVRKKERPRAKDLIPRLFDKFIEYGEGFSHDPNIIAGFAKIEDQILLVIAQNWSTITANGYSLASKVMKKAEEYQIPLVTLIDTPGGDPLEKSAESLQCWKISNCIYTMAGLKVPTISIITGEGGSGGAIALQVADRTYMLENAVYSVISPEGCARILIKDLEEKPREEQQERNREMANLLKPTAQDMLEFGIIDGIIKEPEGGAHTNYDITARNVRETIKESLAELKEKSIDALLKERYERYISYGEWKEEPETEEEKLAREKNKKDSIGKVIKSILKAIRDKFKKIRKQSDDPHIHAIASETEKIQRKFYECKCGTRTPLKRYVRNFKVCPKCASIDRKFYPSAHEWINYLVDRNSFEEKDENLVPLDPLKFEYKTDKGEVKRYKDSIKRAQKKTGVKEALVVGTAKINGMDVILAVSEFGFIGGSMGSVVGEKFVRAVNYANEKNCPLISVSLTGGARMQEGISSLMQMAKTNMALTRRNVPYLSVFADPTMAGSLSSYVTRADVHIAESNAEIAFAGTRVVEGALKGTRIRDERGKSPEWYYAEFYLKHGGINEVVPRKEMRKRVFEYLQLFTDLYQSKGVFKKNAQST